MGTRLYISKSLGNGWRIGTSQYIGGNPGPVGCGCLVVLILLLVGIGKFILDLVQRLLPSALGVGLLAIIFILGQRLAKNNPRMAKHIWIGGGLAAALVVFTVISFYRNQLAEIKNSKTPIASVRDQETLPMPTPEEPALPSMRVDLTFIDLSEGKPTPYLWLLRQEDRVLLPARSQLHLAQDPRGNPDQSTDIKVLPEKCVFVIEDISRPDWMFGKAYHIRQELGYGTFWDELGMGWIKSTDCPANGSLFTHVEDDLFSPILPKELENIGYQTRNNIRLKAPESPRPYASHRIADTSEFMTEELRGVKGQYIKMIISWPNPTLLDIHRNQGDNHTCRMKCENITLSFPASLAIGDYLNELRTNNMCRFARIEGRIESVDNLFVNMVLSDVKLLAYVATTERTDSSGDTDQTAVILTTVPNRSNAQRSSP